jgi:hypothetical protein
MCDKGLPRGFKGRRRDARRSLCQLIEVFMKRRIVIGLSFLFVALEACGGTPPGDAGSGDEQDINVKKAGTPIVEVLEYTGRYNDVPGGDFGSVVLHRDGTFTRFDPHLGVSAGLNYSGPSAPESSGTAALPLKLDRLAATVGPDSTFHHALLVVTLNDGSKRTLTSDFVLVGETACDNTGGEWTDDDADPKTGLFCLCPKPKMWLHASGGCVAFSKKGEACGSDVAIQKQCDEGLRCVAPTTGPISEHTPGTCQ